MNSIQTKVRIDISQGVVELEGSEEFVSKYLDEFKDKILDTQLKPGTAFPQKPKKQKRTSTNKSEKTSKPKKTTPKKIVLEEFDIKGNSTKKIPSLSEFLEEKKVSGSAAKTILVIGYYITHNGIAEEFSEGNIEFAYKALKIPKKPVHLHQIIVNQKNDESWFESGSDKDKWEVSRVGEIYVDEHLPEKNEVKS